MFASVFMREESGRIPGCSGPFEFQYGNEAPINEGFPPDTSSQFTHRRGSRLSFRPHAGLSWPNLTTVK
eukprot:6736022-Pyramimonas_sp.AAC.1